jgi:hypothetical protein
MYTFQPALIFILFWLTLYMPVYRVPVEIESVKEMQGDLEENDNNVLSYEITGTPLIDIPNASSYNVTVTVTSAKHRRHHAKTLYTENVGKYKIIVHCVISYIWKQQHTT